jgi:hypothetical protein
LLKAPLTDCNCLSNVEVETINLIFVIVFIDQKYKI